MWINGKDSTLSVRDSGKYSDYILWVYYIMISINCEIEYICLVSFSSFLDKYHSSDTYGN